MDCRFGHNGRRVAGMGDNAMPARPILAAEPTPAASAPPAV